ncbi:MAG: ferrous iron transport protein B [Tissierellia bacterium]|nr:ferrous iron transport protein B [Tissierellia bacterium]
MNKILALIGNPNSGKTTVFNDLTGSSQYVGNWPGVTIEKKTGRLLQNKGVDLVDLPGIYSLSPYSLEEVITRNYLLEESPDALINVVDSTNLERNLYLTTQVMEMGIPTVIALNMTDLTKKYGYHIDSKKLSKAFGIPVVETSALKGTGLGQLVKTAVELASTGENTIKPIVFRVEIEKALKEIQNLFPKETHQRYRSIKLFERDEKYIEALGQDTKEKLEEILLPIEKQFDDSTDALIIADRYDEIQRRLLGVHRKEEKGQTPTERIDAVVTNKYLALPIFFGIMYAIYYIAMTTVGGWTVEYIEILISYLSGSAELLLANLGASQWAQSLVGQGIIGSVGAIFAFVPQLMILFFFLSILEDTGYMSRIAFIMDRLFRRFGLSGKSFIPMLIGTGCSVPGIMAARTIENPRDRRMTILLTPMIPCGAKLPIFAMFIALIFGGNAWLGPMIYLLSIATVFVSGMILKRLRRFQGTPSPFVMELPPYKVPGLRNVFISMWDKALGFVKKAGSIIFVSSIVLWALQHFNWNLTYLPTQIDKSILADIGHLLRYFFIPLGFGDSWAPAVASISGLIAKEVVVTTFASVGSIVPISFSKVSAFSFILFTMFAAPCFAAIGAMRREFGNASDTWFALFFQTGLAYVSAATFNIIGSFLLKGTSWVEPVLLDYRRAQAISETDILGTAGMLYTFGGLILFAFILTYYSKLRTKLRSTGGDQ